MIAFIDHDHFAEFPVIRGAQKKTTIIMGMRLGSCKRDRRGGGQGWWPFLISGMERVVFGADALN